MSKIDRWKCMLCGTCALWWVTTPGDSREGPIRKWLRGWSYLRVPEGWLCPRCAVAPERSASLVILGGARLRHIYVRPRWDYPFWHALSRLVTLFRRLT